MPHPETLIAKDPVILSRVHDLCTMIADHPTFESHREAVKSFMESDHARGLFDRALMLQTDLRDRRSEGLVISEEEEQEFQKAQEDLFNDETANAFLAAQDDMKETEGIIHLYITRTLQLGRVPEEDELLPDDEGCGCGAGGCGSEDCENEECEKHHN